MTSIASLDHVTKRFGAAVAVDGVSVSIDRGSVVALLGPNGAGKTTALSLLLGLRRPDAGTALLFGDDPRRPQARRRLGCTPQESAFPSTLRVGEVLRLVASHFERPLPLDVLVRRFLLEDAVNRQTGGLSGGQRRRLALALALVGSPALLVLDEPTTGLDVEARRASWRALREYVAEGGTILLTTHYLEEAEALADTVIVLHRGRTVAYGPIDEIRANAGAGRISFRSERLPPGDFGELTDDGATITIRSADPTAAVRALVLAGARLDTLTVQPLPLEDALRRLAEGSN